jgi:hypothetical protein
LLHFRFPAKNICGFIVPFISLNLSPCHVFNSNDMKQLHLRQNYRIITKQMNGNTTQKNETSYCRMISPRCVVSNETLSLYLHSRIQRHVSIFIQNSANLLGVLCGLYITEKLIMNIINQMTLQIMLSKT